MLTPELRAAFVSLGVFVGGCSAAAAAAVAAADAGALAQLARANLIHTAEGRVTLLETLRALRVSS